MLLPHGSPSVVWPGQDRLQRVDIWAGFARAVLCSTLHNFCSGVWRQHRFLMIYSPRMCEVVSVGPHFSSPLYVSDVLALDRWSRGWKLVRGHCLWDIVHAGTRYILAPDISVHREHTYSFTTITQNTVTMFYGSSSLSQHFGN